MEWPSWLRNEGEQVTIQNVESLQDNWWFTGIEALDSKLGGFKPGGIYEVVGEAGSGKTNFALQLAKCFISKGCKCYYLTTQKPLSLSRLRALELDNSSLLVRHANYLDEQMYYINEELKKVLEENETTKLFVLDSIPPLINEDFSGSKEDSIKKSQLLSAISIVLKHLSVKHGLVVLCINNVVSDMQGSVVPSLGTNWANLVNTRFALYKTREERILRVVFSDYIPVKELLFEVNNQGLTFID